MKLRIACVVAGFLSLALSLVPLTAAQTTTETASALPRLVRFGGTVKDLNGNPLTGVVGITFALYSEQTGGAALWIETQNVTANSNGHYVALLGSTTPEGLPADIFNSEQAHWVGVQVSGQAELPRVLLVSAPYALKAGDAETIGGLPPSAFALANSSSAHKNSTPPSNPDVTGKGTVDYIPMWDTTSDIIDSIIFQKASEIGIATTTPAATLDVNGNTDIRNTLTLYPDGTNNTLAVNGTSFKVSSTGEVTFISGQTFPGTGTITGITTASGSGLSGGGTKGTLSLKVPSAGIINAMLANSKITLNTSTAGGLTVPGAMTLGDTYTIGLKTCSANQVLEYVGTAWTCSSAGTGTITGITTASGSGLAGGGTSGTLSLSVPAAGITNAMLANSKVTLNSGTGITAPGAMTLGNTYTVSINTSVVPQLTAANTFSGTQTINSSTGNGVSATSSAAGDSGLFASNTSTASGYGVFASNYNPAGSAVAGVNYSSGTGNAYAIYGQSNGSAGTGVYGTGAANGVYGSSSAGNGVYGQSNGTASGSSGVYGIATTTSGTAPTYGVYGTTGNPNSGSYGVYGSITSPNSGAGVYGSGGTGVAGISTNEYGFGGLFTGYSAPTGSNFDGSTGVHGTGGNADPANGDNGGVGVSGLGGNGGAGCCADGAGGSFTGANNGVGFGDGVDAYPGSGYAGYFRGDVEITGTLNGGTPQVKIDHPQDPANKYFLHASVESSEMKNMYDGNITTDSQGQATVQLPEWFEVLNADFRYQLTVIGQFAQAIVAREIENNRFEIRTSAPNVKVSWQVTGVRQDAYAKAHPLVVEQQKEARLRGFYIHPELYGAPPEKQIEWARHPQMMKRIQEMRARQSAAAHRPTIPAPVTLPAAVVKPVAAQKPVLPQK